MGIGKWKPLTRAKSLIDKNGHFLPLLLPREGDCRPCLAESNWLLDDVVNEFRAQIELGKNLFDRASHVSSHMLKHFQDFDPRLAEVIRDLCGQYDLQDDAFGHGLPRIQGYTPFPRDAEYRITEFKKQLSELSPGTYIFIDHPALSSPELEAFGHEGYWDVALDRTLCLDALTSSTLKEHINEQGIELISYRDL